MSPLLSIWKTTLLSIAFAFTIAAANAQSCKEIMDYVKSKSYGMTYNSYNSEAISKVTFYEITIDYETQYFAIVCFKKEYSYSCSEYIYKVGPRTKLYYSMDYIESAGKAFWKYIEPYSKVLGCAPNLR